MAPNSHADKSFSMTDQWRTMGVMYVTSFGLYEQSAIMSLDICGLFVVVQG